MLSLEKGLLVDLWGTLFYPSVSLEEYHLRRAECLSRVLGLPLESVYEAYMHARRLSDAVRAWSMREVDVVGEVVMMLAKLGVEPERRLVEKLVEAYMTPYVNLLQVAEGAAELLESAREAGYKIVLASNTLSSKHTVLLLRRAGLYSYFDFMALSDSIGFRKPHPRFFSHVILGAGISPQRSIFLGDEESDVVGAQQFGMTTVVYTGFHEYKGSAKPSFATSRLLDVIGLLRG
ncbi:MAG: HAD family hydrolase [Thermofilum sp.]